MVLTLEEQFKLFYRSAVACQDTFHAILQDPHNTQVHLVLLCPLLDEPSPFAALADEQWVFCQ